MSTKTEAPSTRIEFNKIYNSAGHWMWTDVRIPKELKELAAITKPMKSLELGCGLGRFSAYMAEQGVEAIGVDFSSVAINKAKERVADKENRATYLVGDVTNLDMLNEQFDLAFDVGCFHCLNKKDQQKYIAEAHRLLKKGTILLIWALDHSPSDISLNPDYMTELFEGKFRLIKSQPSRRRIMASHWYWLMCEK